MFDEKVVEAWTYLSKSVLSLAITILDKLHEWVHSLLAFIVLNLPLDICLVISNENPQVVFLGVDSKDGLICVLVVDHVDVLGSLVFDTDSVVFPLGFGDDCIVELVA